MLVTHDALELHFNQENKMFWLLKGVSQGRFLKVPRVCECAASEQKVSQTQTHAQCTIPGMKYCSLANGETERVKMKINKRTKG